MSRQSPFLQSGRGSFRILIVDDHPIVRAGLASLIEAEPGLEVCGQYPDAGAALEAIGRQVPDLVLVDLSLRTSSGLELLRELASRRIATLVVSMHGDLVWVERALEAGACGYVHKSEATRDIVAAIEHVRAGGLWVSQPMSEQLLQRRLGRSVAADSDPIDSLSSRELEVFVDIGNGLTTRQIAERLRLSPKTVQTYRQRLKTKLGISTAAELSTAASGWVVTQRDS